MATTFNATITNELGSGTNMKFADLSATHGRPAQANPTTMDAGSSAVVIATPIDPVLGPSPVGTFEWILPNNQGSFVFAYDLHDSPTSFSCTAKPSGYNVVTTLDDSGQATVVVSQ